MAKTFQRRTGRERHDPNEVNDQGNRGDVPAERAAEGPGGSAGYPEAVRSVRAVDVLCFATEYEPEDRVLYGFCVSPLGPDCDEWGYTSLDEIEATKNRFGLYMERDKYFQPARASEVKEIPRRRAAA